VPLFLSIWGASLYGDWVILFAVPAYLSIGDAGFANAAINSMTMAVGRGDRASSQETFSSTFVLISAVATSLLVLFVALCVLLPTSQILGLGVLTEGETILVCALFGLQVIGVLHANLAWGLFAAEGRYGVGNRYLARSALLEFALAAAAAALGAGVIGAAAGLCVGRWLGTATMYAQAGNAFPWARLDFGVVEWRIAKELISPALASAAFPVGNALSLQGITVVTGTVLGPIAAATLVSGRTLTRVALQALRTVVAVVHPEVSAAHGAGDTALVRTLNRRASNLAVWLAIGTVVILWFLGPMIVDVWTGGKLEPGAELIRIFLCVAAINSVWFTSLIVLYATNRHQRLGVTYLVLSAAAVALAFPLAGAMGTSGPALAVLVAEIGMAVAVLPPALRAADDRVIPFLRSLLAPPRLPRGALRSADINSPVDAPLEP
jgi:O-antigen/teichoic acid export membrane protein